MNESKVEVWLDRFDKETFVVGVRKGGKYDARKVNLWHEDQMRDALAESIKDIMENINEPAPR